MQDCTAFVPSLEGDESVCFNLDASEVITQTPFSLLAYATIQLTFIKPLKIDGSFPVEQAYMHGNALHLGPTVLLYVFLNWQLNILTSHKL